MAKKKFYVIVMNEMWKGHVTSTSVFAGEEKVKLYEGKEGKKIAEKICRFLDEETDTGIGRYNQHRVFEIGYFKNGLEKTSLSYEEQTNEKKKKINIEVAKVSKYAGYLGRIHEAVTLKDGQKFFRFDEKAIWVRNFDDNCMCKEHKKLEKAYQLYKTKKKSATEKASREA